MYKMKHVFFSNGLREEEEEMFSLTINVYKKTFINILDHRYIATTLVKCMYQKCISFYIITQHPFFALTCGKED